METHREAIDYLELYFHLPSSRRGAIVQFTSVDHLEQLRAKRHLLFQEITQLDSRTWRAPSPWHASALLLHIAHRWASLPPLKGPGSPLFRGQRDPSWPLIPYLHRFDDPKPHTHALDIFCLALEHLTIEEATDVGKDTHLAAAQHYGLPTELLDFTVDPLVAAYFACKGAPDAQDVVVYWQPFNYAMAQRVKIVLAPPWLRRIQRQRGIFIRYPTIPSQGLTDRYLRLLFPARSTFLDWLETQPEGDPLPEDTWLTAACHWARNYHSPLDLTAPETAQQLAAALCAAIGEPPFLYDAIRPESALATARYFAEICDWLALRVKTGDPFHEFAFECVPLLAIQRDNPGWFGAALKVGELFPQNDPLRERPFGALVTAMEECVRQDRQQKGHWALPLTFATVWDTES